MPAPAVILLDALGTLLALRPPAPALRSELSTRFGVQVEVEDAERALAAEIAYYRAHLQEGRDAESLAALRARCAEIVRAALPQTPPLLDASSKALTEALLAALNFAAFPDVEPALRDARDRGLKLIVVSNWDVSLPDVLARTGLAPLLDGVITSAQIGARKPSPAIFEHALAMADVGPDQALHVGDSLEEDISGARAAGIAAVLVRRDGTPGPPEVPTIRRLDELGPYLRP
jgi:putative hydrolase of the HAD superfamily